MKIAVYGTLLTGERNCHVGAGAKSRIPCTIHGTLYDTGYGFPAFIQGDGADVASELLEVDDAVLWRLDQLEGYPHLYGREEVVATLEDGTQETAMVYVMKNLPKGAQVIKSGDWCKYRKERYN